MKHISSDIHFCSLDVLMMREEVAELQGWKKHMSTKDRIRADRRNYELGLFALESLPKDVMKEALFCACRELDVSELSELKPGIAKLKAVVRAVPRMERFITSVCSYVFARGGPALQEKPVMEDALPVLKSWWQNHKSAQTMRSFALDIFTEMKRRESMLATLGTNDNKNITPTMLEEQWLNEDQFPVDRWDRVTADAFLRNNSAALAVIRDLADFQIEVFQTTGSFTEAAKFVSKRPDELVNRLVAHIQSLFDAPELYSLS